MTARELEELLHVANVKPTLTHLSGQGRLRRAKIAGGMVYFAGEPWRHQQQLQRRETEAAARRVIQPLPDPQHVIALLVEIIRHPRQTPRQWARRLIHQGIRLPTARDSSGARPLSTVRKKRALEFLKVRGQLLRTWSGPLPKAGQLPADYLLEVASEHAVCQICGGRLRRQRSSTRYPRGAILGQPRVRYVEKKCVLCGKIHRPETYHQVVPPQGNYAFDLIVEVGLARFRQHWQNGEIQAELLARYGLRLPCSTINELAHTFLDCLAATHQARAPQLRKRLEDDGGYVLHVDGTCEPGTDTVFNAVAGNRGWTLEGAKMSGEDVTQIAGLLRRCVASFGTPLAVVRDLSPQIESAGKRPCPRSWTWSASITSWKTWGTNCTRSRMPSSRPHCVA